MPRAIRIHSNETAGSKEFFAMDRVWLRTATTSAFKNTNWIWEQGEQWAILGPDGSGKSLLLEAILGRATPVHGEVRGPFVGTEESDPFVGATVAHVSPQIQRDLATHESSFYQERWHSGEEHGPRTVGQYLSQESVEERNPFEVGSSQGNAREFLKWRSRLLSALDIKHLWSRKLRQLSNGEMRKVVLVHALLKRPALLILEDLYAGIDAASRKRIAAVISDLMKESWVVLFATHRPEEIPAATTHLLIVDKFKVVAQGPRRAMLCVWRERFADRHGTRPRRERQERPSKRPCASGTPIVEFEHVSIAGSGRAILKEIDWVLREGECWALLGPNGAGKTTLLNLIQGDHPQAYAQQIRLFGRRTDSTQALWEARQKIGWMSPELHQHYPHGWSNEDVVCSGFFNTLGLHQAASRRQRNTARQWLADLGLGRHTRTTFDTLPFGQQRLVLLARSVVKKPRLLILDEPGQGLDAAQRPMLMGAVDRVVAQTGASLIYVTHHKAELPHCITHQLQLRAGIIQSAQVRRRA